MLPALAYFLVAFGAVLVLEKWVHRMMQECFLLLTGHMESATLLYSIALFPGVALLELSHAVMAVLLGVKVRGFSLRAQRQPSGVVRLGYVEVLRTDNFRTSLIGAAPFFAGLLALIVIGTQVFDLSAMTHAFDAVNVPGFFRGLFSIFSANDSVLYIYLVFAVANGMMPSKSDTQAWPPVLAGFAAVLALAAIIGGSTLLTWIEPGARAALSWLGGAFTLTAFVDVVVVLLLWLIARTLERATGRKVTFHK